MPFYPGPGVGGHCIPVDPYYLAARAREVGFHERFIETAGDINSRMPDHVIGLVASALNTRGKPVRGSRVLVVGVAFKPGVSDDRNTPARPIIAGLLDAGAEVVYHDPHLPSFDVAEEHGSAEGARLESLSLADANLASMDCVVIVTPHADIDWTSVFTADLIVDTRDSSRNRPTRPGQVLRLGAGWS
jgi:UDP-N-acetyl-D-glucosamine dehydrogenase